MKKLKNKFIIWVISVITIIVGIQVFIAYSNNQRDTHSYLTNLKGSVQINEESLLLDAKQRIHAGDKISVGEKSLALVEWWDGSLTRLGENTKISVEENQVSQDYTKIQISFDLISGKTWSNVVSFLGNESYFTQSFQGIEAGVRGTVFDVDLEKDFIKVSDHQVVLTNKQGETLLVEEDKPVKISSWILINLQEFITSFQDIAWENLNIQSDTNYLTQLKGELEKSLKQTQRFLFFLDFISPKYRILHFLDTKESYTEIAQLLESLPEKKLPEVYKAVYSRYQDFNFVQSKDFEFYKRKVFYKKALLFLTPNETEKENLIQATIFDLENITQSEAWEWLQETFEILLEHKEVLQKINIQNIEWVIDMLPESMKTVFQNEFKFLENILKIQKGSISLPEISLPDPSQIWDQVKGIFETQIQDMRDTFKK
jgi:hypothetical protein